MQRAFRTGRRTLAVRGLLALVFGLALLLWPNITLQEMVMLIGAYVAIDGLVAVAVSLRWRSVTELWWIPLLEGACGVLAGLMALLWPAMTVQALIVLVGIWSITTGIIEILMARALAGDPGLRLMGAASVLLGAVLVAFPGPAVLLLTWLVGLYAFGSGLLLIRLSLRLREGTSAGSVT